MLKCGDFCEKLRCLVQPKDPHYRESKDIATDIVQPKKGLIVVHLVLIQENH